MTDWDREEAEQRIAELKAECNALSRRVLEGEDYSEVQRLRAELRDAMAEIRREKSAYTHLFSTVHEMRDALSEGDIEKAKEVFYAWRKS